MISATDLDAAVVSALSEAAVMRFLFSILVLDLSDINFNLVTNFTAIFFRHTLKPAGNNRRIGLGRISRSLLCTNTANRRTVRAVVERLAGGAVVVHKEPRTVIYVRSPRPVETEATR